MRSEVSVPLRAGDTVIGVLNIESGQDAPPLDEGDLDTMVLVGDRVAGALALAREREALRERAALFARLAAFGNSVTASLDLATAHAAIVRSVAEALQADIVSLVLRDPATGDDRIVAISGGDERYVGVRIPPGEGIASQAMIERRVMSSDAVHRSSFPSTLQRARVEDVLVTAAIPLLNEDSVVGAICVNRRDLARPFTALELEAMPLFGSQVTLALDNVDLHARIADAAIRDPLTGLWNRRHLEVSTDAAVRGTGAARRWTTATRWRSSCSTSTISARSTSSTATSIGDAVLRTFGSILSRRLRSSDLVARFGGEEFVAILDGATVEEAHRVADEIRRELESCRVTGSDGEQLRATVSAGCASLGPAVATLEALLEVADVGLQMAKRGGRNQVVAA